MPDTGTVPLGHNRPPAAEIAALHKPRVDDLIANANAWAKEIGTVKTEAEAAKLEDFLEQLRKEWKHVDDARKEEKRPHDEAGEAVQRAFVPLLRLLTTAAEVMKPLKKEWLDALAARQRAEAARRAEEARQAQEAAEMAAASAAAKLGPAVQAQVAAEDARTKADEAARAAAEAAAAKPQVRSDLTGRASGYRSHWSAEITDPVAAFAHYRNHRPVMAALQQCADADARAMKAKLNIPGVRAVEDRRV